MTYRPLVAVVAYHLGDDRVARWPHGGYGVPGPYIDCLRRAGAGTAIVCPGEDGAPGRPTGCATSGSSSTTRKAYAQRSSRPASTS